LVNPLLTYVNDVKDRDAASSPNAGQPWSEFSDPVSVPPTAEFFLTGSFPSKGQVWSRFLHLPGAGRQQTARHSRQSIQTRHRSTFPTRESRRETHRHRSELRRGAVVVGINFGKTILKGGVLAKDRRDALLDSAGTLRSRLLEFDSQSDVYKKFNSQAPK